MLENSVRTLDSFKQPSQVDSFNYIPLLANTCSTRHCRYDQGLFRGVTKLYRFPRRHPADNYLACCNEL